jgi:hypothetical protein
MIKPNISIGITPDSKKMVSKYFDTYTRYVNGKEVSTTYSKYESGIYGSPTGSSESGSVSFSLSNQVEMKIRNDLQADTSKTDKEKFRKIALIENLSFNTSYNFFAEGTKWADVSMSGSTGLFKKKISINLSATFTPYDNDQEGTKINEFRFVNGKSMFRMTQANIGLSGSIDPTTFDPKNTAPIIPWRMSINYGLSINSNWITASQTYNIKTSQSLTINGSLEFTKKWNLQYGTGYDFENKKVTSTNLNITRDLHCWQMSMNWIPFGQLKSYSFQINVKASVFDGIKYNLREDIIRSSF